MASQKRRQCSKDLLSEQADNMLQPTVPALVSNLTGGLAHFLEMPALILQPDAVTFELQRLRQAHSKGVPTCHNPHCDHLGQSIFRYKNGYQSFGHSGDKQRYRCKSCGMTFVDKCSGSNKYLRLQTQLLTLLLRGARLREICHQLQLNPKSFYDHLEYIANRCRRKMALVETHWDEQRSYQLASHCRALQPHSNNGVYWVASAEANTGYILAHHVNYSPYNADEFVLPDTFCADSTHFIQRDYVTASFLPLAPSQHGVLSAIGRNHPQLLATQQLQGGYHAQAATPLNGQLIPLPYTLCAHYLHLLSCCQRSKSISLIIDPEPLMHHSALNACIVDGQHYCIDIIYVAEDPDWVANRNIDVINSVQINGYPHPWLLARQGKQQKAIYDISGQHGNPSLWMRSATTAPVQAYQSMFQTLFSHVINEPRRRQRPASILPLLDIFRAWYNLCCVDKKNRTPAQRCGLTQHAHTIRQLLS